MSAYQNHHHHNHIDSSYQNRCMTHKHHCASSRILFLYIIILVDKLYSSFELVIAHESNTTTVVEHWSGVHGELDVNVT